MVDSQQSPAQPSMTRFPSVIASSATARPRSKLQYGTNPFGFEAKSAFDAGRDLTQFRSVLVRLSPPPSVDDPWRRPPPDFRPQVYEPRPPKRNTRDAMKVQPDRSVYHDNYQLWLSSFWAISPLKQTKHALTMCTELYRNHFDAQKRSLFQ